MKVLYPAALSTSAILATRSMLAITPGLTNLKGAGFHLVERFLLATRKPWRLE